jgi:hypothetical protein
MKVESPFYVIHPFPFLYYNLSVMDIGQELLQYNITVALKELLVTDNKYILHEYLNCLERWVLSLAVISGTCVFYKTNINDPVNHKLKDELKEKKIPLLVKQILLMVNKGLIMPIPVIIRNNTKAYIDKKTHTQGWVVNITTGTKNNEKKVTIKIPMANHKYEAFQQTSLEQHCITLMLLRYSTMINRGQQWALPHPQFEHLYEKYGINHEGFASPLNSSLLGRAGGKFCSLFKDTDSVFGSIGSFFERTLYYKAHTEEPNHWVINPPFVESLIKQVSEKIVMELETAFELGVEIMVVYVLPTWPDSDGYIKIQESKFLKHTHQLEKNKHFYEHLGKRIIANTRSNVFILDTYKIPKDYADIVAPMTLGNTCVF